MVYSSCIYEKSFRIHVLFTILGWLIGVSLFYSDSENTE